MTDINERDEDAYYDAYDEDIAAGRVKPVRTTLRNAALAADVYTEGPWAVEHPSRPHGLLGPVRLVGEPDSGSAQDDVPAGRLHALVVADADDGHEIEVPLDALILCQGLSPTLAPLESWQLPMEGRYLPVDPATMASAIPGIHAVGDICTYPGKLKLIVTGFAEAARAAQSVAQFIAGKPPLFEYTAISLRQQRRLGVLTEETLATRLRPHLHFPEGL